MIKLGRETTVRVGDVMSPRLITVDVSMSPREAAAALAEHRISGAPVVSGSANLVGIVSRADLIDPRHQSGEATLADVMTRVLYAVRTTDPVMAAVRLMVDESIHRVVVVDASGALAGIVTSMDIMRALARSEPSEGIALEYVPLAST
jgi:CBS-domain-containing membrane protein